MINLEEIGRFVLAKPGEGLELPGERRKVRLELNTAEPCQLQLQTGPKELRFLANVEGRETVTFIADGPVTVWPSCDGEVWWWCSEMESTATVIEDAKIFTKVAERQPRNPDLDRVVAAMTYNQRQREAALMQEIRALSGQIESVKQEAANAKPAKRNKGAADGAQGAAGAAAAAGASAAPEGDAGGADDDEQS